MNIRHDLTESRFVALSEDLDNLGSIVYDVEADGNLSALSVHVAPQMQGRGIAGSLLDALVGYARKHRLKIFPVCPYVVKKFQQHPDQYGDVNGALPPKP